MTQNHSPLPDQVQSPSITKKEESKEELFDFPTALKKVIEGKKISKKEWGNPKIYGVLKDEKLMLHKEDGIDYGWLISSGDLIGKDWYVIR